MVAKAEHIDGKENPRFVRKAQTIAEGAAPKTTSAAVEPIQIQVEGLPAQVLYAGATPCFPGLNQINVRLPKLPDPCELSRRITESASMVKRIVEAVAPAWGRQSPVLPSTVGPYRRASRTRRTFLGGTTLA